MADEQDLENWTLDIVDGDGEVFASIDLAPEMISMLIGIGLSKVLKDQLDEREKRRNE